jgi:hypothetical protein
MFFVLFSLLLLVGLGPLQVVLGEADESDRDDGDGGSHQAQGDGVVEAHVQTLVSIGHEFGAGLRAK